MTNPTTEGENKTFLGGKYLYKFGPYYVIMENNKGVTFVDDTLKVIQISSVDGSVSFTDFTSLDFGIANKYDVYEDSHFKQHGWMTRTMKSGGPCIVKVHFAKEDTGQDSQDPDDCDLRLTVTFRANEDELIKVLYKGATSLGGYLAYSFLKELFQKRETALDVGWSYNDRIISKNNDRVDVSCSVGFYKYIYYDNDVEKIDIRRRAELCLSLKGLKIELHHRPAYKDMLYTYYSIFSVDRGWNFVPVFKKKASDDSIDNKNNESKE